MQPDHAARDHVRTEALSGIAADARSVKLAGARSYISALMNVGLTIG
jgi:hypothetical protein